MSKFEEHCLSTLTKKEPLYVFFKDFSKTYNIFLFTLHLLTLGTAICEKPQSVAVSENTQPSHLLVQSQQ